MNKGITSDTPPNYTGGRKLTLHTVEENNDGSILTVGGTGFSTKSEAVLDLLQPGVDFELETIGFSQITGFKIEGDWIERKADADLKREHEEMVAGFKEKNLKRLEQNREDWTRREAELPQWLRDRLEHFHATGKENFEIEGWGYELVACEIAALIDSTMPDLTKQPVEDSAAVAAYCSEQGVSGNQYGIARALVVAHREEPERSMSGTVSALTPLTGDPFYTGKGAEEND